MEKVNVANLDPDRVLKKVFHFLIPKDYLQDMRRVYTSTFIASFLCYFMLMVTGYGGPDAVIEGVNMYQGFGWAISTGRWIIAYLQQYAFGNAIIPFLIVMLYTFFTATAVLLVCRMTNIRNPFYQVILSAIFICFPVVVLQFGFLYMAVYYAFAFLCAVLGIFFVRQKKIYGYVIATILFVLMLGSYQTYIGAVAAFSIILFVFDMIDGKRKLEALRSLLFTMITGFLAAGLDLLIVKGLIKLKKLEEADRVSEFSLKDIFENFSFSFKFSVTWFFSYFGDDRFSRNIIYIVLFAIIIVGLILALISLFRKKKYVEMALLVLMTYLIPHSMNIVQYLFPHNGIYDIMRYHYVLIFVFLAGLVERCSYLLPKCILKWVSYLLLIVLTGTFVISGNIAGIVYKVIYTETHTEASAMINRVYELDGFAKGETRVILSNPIDWPSTYAEYGLLRAETDIGAGPVFWGDFTGLNACRRNYFMNYFGIDVGYIELDEYLRITKTKQYEDMPVWPAEGSVAMIDGFAVIKNEE